MLHMFSKVFFFAAPSISGLINHNPIHYLRYHCYGEILVKVNL